MTTSMSDISLSLTREQQDYLYKRLSSIPESAKRDSVIIQIGNSLKNDHITYCGVFVDLPNGNKGMILVSIIDFGIQTGSPGCDYITKPSYIVDLPEMEIAMAKVEAL